MTGLMVILYHVHSHDGYTTIIFSSKDLYNKFVASLEKELHPQPISAAKGRTIIHIFVENGVLFPVTTT